MLQVVYAQDQVSGGCRSSMSISDKIMPITIGGFVLLGIGIMAYRAISPDTTRAAGFKVPTLSAQAVEGQVAYDSNCAQCHGKNGAGSDKGPPLVHDTYNPGHHPDGAFFRAARQGVRSHHWRFGNMPPRPGVTDQQLLDIVRYIREMQEANGIFSRPHNM